MKTSSVVGQSVRLPDPAVATEHHDVWAWRAATLRERNGPLERLALSQGLLVTRAQARRAGITDAEVRRRLYQGEWTAPRRGVLCLFPTDGAEEIGIAAVALVRRDAVVSHESAAVLHGLPVLHRAERVRLTVRSVNHGGGWPGCVVHAAPIRQDERTAWYGLDLTTPARTTVDVARRSGVGAGLVVADAALRSGLVTRSQLIENLRLSRGRPGVVAARNAVEHASPGAESALESLTRWCLIDGGISEALTLQAPIHTDQGVYRVDLLIEGTSVIVEADGRLKYTSPDVLWREKRRQDALERAGYRIVRVTWDEVMRDPSAVVARVRRAIAAPLVRAY